MALAAPAPEARDGRHRRRERSRNEVVTVTLRLVRDRGRLPSMAAIAEAARLTERTVFNLFGDKQALMLAVLGAYRSEALAALPPVPCDARLSARLSVFLDQLAPFLEDYARVRWAAQASGVAVPDMERGVILRALSSRVRAVIGDDAPSTVCDPAFDAALAVAVDPTTWRLYRVQLRLGVEASRAAMMRTILALVGRT